MYDLEWSEKWVSNDVIYRYFHSICSTAWYVLKKTVVSFWITFTLILWLQDSENDHYKKYVFPRLSLAAIMFVEKAITEDLHTFKSTLTTKEMKTA